MIADPIRYVKQFAEAGADLITFHIESNSDPAATIAAIHEAGVKAGIVLKPNTPLGRSHSLSGAGRSGACHDCGTGIRRAVVPVGHGGKR